MDTKTLVQKMIIKFYEYIMAAELSVNPNTPFILVGNNKEYLYFPNNHRCMHSLLSEAILLDRNGSKFVIHQNTVAGTEITDNFGFLNWFQNTANVITHADTLSVHYSFHRRFVNWNEDILTCRHLYCIVPWQSLCWNALWFDFHQHKQRCLGT